MSYVVFWHAIRLQRTFFAPAPDLESRMADITVVALTKLNAKRSYLIPKRAYQPWFHYARSTLDRLRCAIRVSSSSILKFSVGLSNGGFVKEVLHGGKTAGTPPNGSILHTVGILKLVKRTRSGQDDRVLR